MDAETSPPRRAGAARTATLPEIPAPTPPLSPCDTCAADAFVLTFEADLPPSYNAEYLFTLQESQRRVIEFVTATVEVPAGESARLRMYTGLSNGAAGNFDLALTPQGIAEGQSVYVCTHQVRLYTDGFLGINVNRDNATTSGTVLMSVSGYLV